MRIIAGQRRGMVLNTFDHQTIRPTKDIVREYMFNCLANHVDISACNVCDLFAGTGALGIEALSRGARHATFVDSAMPAIGLVKENLRKTRMSDLSFVEAGDVFEFIRHTDRSFDVVFADPPYQQHLSSELLKSVGRILKTDGIFILESSPVEERLLDEAAWILLKKRKWGESLVTILKKTVYHQ